MGIRYLSTIKSTFTATEFGVQIYDTSFTGTPMNITLGGDGVELTYLQQSDEKFAAIKGSEAKIFLKITDNSAGTELQNWINSVLLANNEDKYQVSLSKGSELIWFGNILHDLSGLADDSRPYDFVLTATDGLARLKDFTFTEALTDRSNTFKQLLYLILQETPLSKFGLFTYLFSTAVEWWEDSMPSRSSTLDPLALSRVHNFAFAPFNENDQIREAMSYWDVLTYICEAWGMRVIMSQGRYKFIQVNNYEDVATTRYERRYLINGNFDSSITLANEIDINAVGVPFPRVKAGNQWSYFAPFKSVKVRFPYDNKNMMPFQPIQMPYFPFIAGPLIGGTGIKLIFYSLVRWIVYSGGAAMTGLALTDYRISIRCQLRVGNNYLTTAFGGSYIWVTGTTPFFFIEFNNNKYDSIIDYPMSFTTPDIPTGTYADGDLSVDNFEVIHIASGKNILTSSQEYVVSGSTALYYNANVQGQDENFFVYRYDNTSTAINSLSLDLPDAIIGENFQPNYFGGISVYNGSSWVFSTSKWRILDSGTAYNFIARRVVEILAAQSLPIPKYQGAIIGEQVYPDSLISYAGKNYIINGGTFKFNSETWDGEWFVVSTDRASAFEIDNATNQDGGNTNQDLRRAIGGLNERFSDTSNRSLYFPYEVDTISANTTGIGPSKIFLCSSAITFTLPPAANWITNGNSSLIMIKNICTGSGDRITVNPYGSELIEGNGSLTIDKFHTYTLISDGTAIWILNYYKHS